MRRAVRVESKVLMTSKLQCWLQSIHRNSNKNHDENQPTQRVSNKNFKETASNKSRDKTSPLKKGFLIKIMTKINLLD